MSENPWAHDRLERQATGEHLIRLLCNRFEARTAVGSGSYTLNLDASWGEGKSFFLECLANDLKQRGHVVATVNAWQDDHGDDALVTVMTAIEEALSPFLINEKTAASKNLDRAKKALSIVASETTKQVGLHFLKLTTGIAVGKIIDELKSQQSIDGTTTVNQDKIDTATTEVWNKLSEGLVSERVAQHKLAKEKAVEFRSYAAKAIEYVADNNMLKPMFVIIDELDRCRPLYAVKLLEEVKHLFAIPGVVFIIATDTAQLSHSVKAIYGQDFEARKYLKRFFDQTFIFPEASKKDLIPYLLWQHRIDIPMSFFPTGGVEPEKTFVSWAESLKLSNRDIVQCLELVSIFVNSWNNRTRIEPVYLLVLIWSFYFHETVDLYQTPKNSQGYTDMVNWVQSYQHHHLGQLSIKNASGQDVYDAVRHVSQIAMAQASNTDALMYLDYLAHERKSRFGDDWNSDFNRGEKSFLREYESRVKHAGRTLNQVL